MYYRFCGTGVCDAWPLYAAFAAKVSDGTNYLPDAGVAA